jgi:hypothetical protein
MVLPSELHIMVSRDSLLVCFDNDSLTHYSSDPAYRVNDQKSFVAECQNGGFSIIFDQRCSVFHHHRPSTFDVCPYIQKLRLTSSNEFINQSIVCRCDASLAIGSCLNLFP